MKFELSLGLIINKLVTNQNVAVRVRVQLRVRVRVREEVRVRVRVTYFDLKFEPGGQGEGSD